ncbi:MAG: D-alanyl-D-alanine carboxypeptidase [Eubacteriales bacterium]|nr:D-alanyl-D-alanine carboxypeptidase [Eubacteriales bacterium]
MKRITSICLVFFAVLMLFMGTASATVEYTGEVTPNAVMLLDADTGQVLYSTDNADIQIRPASTTKILTCILAIENCDMDEVVTISSKAAGSRTGSYLGLSTGEEICMKDLLIGMMLKSGNDAAIAVAEHVGDTVEDFVIMMNDFAANELDMTSSNFVNPNGLDNDEHVVTLNDMKKLVLYAFQNETFMDIVGRESYDMPETNMNDTVKNTNHLLQKDSEDYYSYATGIKTGDTKMASKCLVASATKDGMNLICLIFGDDNDDRWDLAKNLFNWGFDNFETVDLAVLFATTDPVQVQVENCAADDESGGLLEFDASGLAGTYVTLEKTLVEGILDGTVAIESSVELSKETIEAPITQGYKLGTVTYTNAETGEDIYSKDLIAPRDVYETGSEGDTAVTTMTPVTPIDVGKNEGSYAWFLLIIPGGLIVFLVIRLLTANRKKRSRRFKHRKKPHYSYRIK